MHRGKRYLGRQKVGGSSERGSNGRSGGAVALNILLALADGERHGYGIMVEVRERTGGKMQLGPGTLYGSIKRMVKDGLIEESKGVAEERTDDGRRYDAERRRYHRLTGFGERVLAAELARLEAVMWTARTKGVSLRPPGGNPPEPSRCEVSFGQPNR